MPQNFVPVAQTHELEPGTKKRVWVGETRILLVNLDGEFFALDDLCPHARAFMSAGWLDGDEIMCPLHGAQFNVRTGQFLSPPAEDDLPMFAVKVEGDTIMVAAPQP